MSTLISGKMTYMRRMFLIILMSLLIVFTFIGCGDEKQTNESVSLKIDSISRIDVANGTTGDFVLLEDEDTYDAVQNVIRENRFTRNIDEEEEGWIIGVRIYSGGEHYWFKPDGVRDYYYENPDLFKELLLIISEEKEIDFVKDYLKNRKE